MTKEYIKELEALRKHYKRKIFLKITLAFVLLLVLFFLAFKAFMFYKEQKNLLSLAQSGKQSLQRQLELSKVQEQKNKLLKEKKALQELVLLEKEQEKLDKISFESSLIDPNALKKEFYQLANFKTAFHLAQFHYDNKDYKKAIFWSLKANELDKNKANVWVIFIKAQLALGEKEKAQKARENFMHFYPSSALLAEVDFNE